MPHASVRFGVVIVVIHTDASFGGWIIIRNHLRKVTIRATGTRSKVVGLFAIIWADSKSLHNRLISFFSGCVHFAIQRPGVESA